MRASTVFILALAILIGLAVAAAAKSAGLFKEKVTPPVEKIPAPRVLAARENLYEGVSVTSNQVYLRELRTEEETELRKRFGDNWKEKVMQPLVTAAHLRVPRRSVLADTILMRDDFNTAELPDRITAQLEPNTRAVNVSVPKDKAVGGVLRVGEYVDVFLTTKIGVGDREELRTACIARGCKVIMKRNVMWTLFAADPDDKPLHFTLQANAYRAALIEYAQTHGQMSLFPVATPPKATGTFSDPSSPEYATEDQRVDEMMRGTRTIGSEDLIRIFQVPPPPAPAPAAPPPFVVQHIQGVNPAGSTILTGATGTGAAPAPTPAPAAKETPRTLSGGSSGAPQGSGAQQAGYTFQLPSATGDAGCKGCEERKKAAADAAKYKTIRSGN